MANKARGEAEIKLGGETFVCVASLGALARIEGRIESEFSFEEIVRARVSAKFMEKDQAQNVPVTLQDALAFVSMGHWKACLIILEETCTDGRDKIADLIAGPVELANAAAEVFQASGLLGGEASEKN